MTEAQTALRMTRMETTAPKLPKSLFAYMLFYGGMVTTAGILGVKQIAIGPLSVEAGIFAFLLLVIMGSSVTELHGKDVADTMVRWGFVPLIAAALLIRLVLILPTDPGMYPPAITAFPIVVGQGARMMIAGLIAYGTSQTLNVLIFSKLARGGGNLVWLRGMIASAVSQVVDTLLFITISFYGERPILGLMAGQMLTKVLLSVVLVPWLITFFVAFGRKLDRA